MAEHSVHQWIDEDQRGVDTDWEEVSYREGCTYARELAEHRLKALDDELMRTKPKGWISRGFRERTVATRFGEVPVRRRMYRDSEGQFQIPFGRVSGVETKTTGESVHDRERRGNGR